MENIEDHCPLKLDFSLPDHTFSNVNNLYLCIVSDMSAQGAWPPEAVPPPPRASPNIKILLKN